MTVTPATIAVELGRTAPSSDAEAEQWSQWIQDALMLIGARLGDVTALDQERLDYVVRQAVASHVRRPDDATAVTIAIDDGSSSRTYRPGKGRITILDEWWDLLSPTTSTSGAFSITPSGHVWDHLPWCSLSLGALGCSCGADLGYGPIYELGLGY